MANLKYVMPLPVPKSYKWDQAQINNWAVTTFGYPTDFKPLFDRTNDEYQELYDEVYRDEWHNVDGVKKECADVLIMLYQLADYCGFDLNQEVDKKMEINLNRKWVNTGEGVGKHVDYEMIINPPIVVYTIPY
jgi:NTP pyrophosphatase (non-canonical NTP hydrolase)